MGLGIKGDPVAALIATDGIEGYLTRTQIACSRKTEDDRLAEQRISRLLSDQAEDGSWSHSIIDTAGNVGLLLDYGCPPDYSALAAAMRWLMERQVVDPSLGAGLFVELGDREDWARQARYLQRRYAEFNPLVDSEFCCGANVLTTTCCALETFFKLGEDVSTDARICAAVDRVIALANATGGLCAGRLGELESQGNRRICGHNLWTRKDNTMFRRAWEENPGVTICAHFFVRAISRSPVLRQSPLMDGVMKTWRKRQTESGNFDTRYHQYSVYYAADTLRLCAELPDAQTMFEAFVPVLLRRQRKGLWWKNGQWLAPTFAAVRALHRFGYMDG